MPDRPGRQSPDGSRPSQQLTHGQQDLQRPELQGLLELLLDRIQARQGMQGASSTLAKARLPNDINGGPVPMQVWDCRPFRAGLRSRESRQRAFPHAALYRSGVPGPDPQAGRNARRQPGHAFPWLAANATGVHPPACPDDRAGVSATRCVRQPGSNLQLVRAAGIHSPGGGWQCTCLSCPAPNPAASACMQPGGLQPWTACATRALAQGRVPGCVAGDAPRPSLRRTCSRLQRRAGPEWSVLTAGRGGHDQDGMHSRQPTSAGVDSIPCRASRSHARDAPGTKNGRAQSRPAVQTVQVRRLRR
jgi:hypothetical protein